MLLYITTGESRDRDVKPLHTIPDTVTELFYLAMREHARGAALQYGRHNKWLRDPDWRFDRQVIRFALFLSVNLAVQPEDRVAIFGQLHPLWLQADFALQGMRSIPVGLAGSLADDRLVQAVHESDPRVVVATDRESVNRLLAVRARIGERRVIVTPFGSSEGDDGVIGLDYLWDRAQILDTPERAQNWRAGARAVGVDQVAGVHYSIAGEDDLVREEFTHREAMEFVRDRVTRCPAQPDDVAYFEAETVTTISRKSFYALIGDGYSVVTMPLQKEDVISELSPAKLIASGSWLEGLSARLEASGGDRRSREAREILSQMVGDRLRWVEPTTDLPEQVERRLLEAGLPLPALALGGN